MMTAESIEYVVLQATVNGLAREELAVPALIRHRMTGPL